MSLEDDQEDIYLVKILRTLVIFYKTILLRIRGALLNICDCIYPCLVILSLSIHKVKWSLTLCSYKDFLSHNFAYEYDYRLKKSHKPIITLFNSVNMLRAKFPVCIYIKKWWNTFHTIFLFLIPVPSPFYSHSRGPSGSLVFQTHISSKEPPGGKRNNICSCISRKCLVRKYGLFHFTTL